MSLESFLVSGGLLQVDSDQFILLIESQKPVSEAIALYSPNFWDFLQPEKAVFQEVQAISADRLELVELLEKVGSGLPQTLKLIEEQKKNFEAQFTWSQKNFSSGALKKTVPITRFDYLSSGNFQFVPHLLAALKKPSANRLYGFWKNDEGFLGATPETLASWDGKTLSTMALAGTWKSSEDRSISEVDAKTREEHEFVINDIRERLEKVNIGETHILKLPVLSHLKTEINASCSSKEKFIENMKALHPTAALGIYPRDFLLAKEFSEFLLQAERQFFGAPFGVVGPDFGHVVVAIRNMMWSKNRVMLHTGCGVTAQSKLEAEWQELQTKKNAIIEAFSLQIS